MPKRFTATEKWDDSWFCSLLPLDKLFWLYITDKCDSSGMWDVNEPLVKFHMGNDYVLDASRFGEKIKVVSGSKWFIPGFIPFQYGSLKPGSKFHDSVIAVLSSHESKGLARGLQAPPKDLRNKGQDNIGQDRIPGSDLICGLPAKQFSALSWAEQQKRRTDWEAYNPKQTVKTIKKAWTCKGCGKGRPEVEPDPIAWEGGVCKNCSKEF